MISIEFWDQNYSNTRGSKEMKEWLKSPQPISLWVYKRSRFQACVDPSFSSHLAVRPAPGLLHVSLCSRKIRGVKIVEGTGEHVDYGFFILGWRSVCSIELRCVGAFTRPWLHFRWSKALAVSPYMTQTHAHQCSDPQWIKNKHILVWVRSICVCIMYTTSYTCARKCSLYTSTWSEFTRWQILHRGHSHTSTKIAHNTPKKETAPLAFPLSLTVLVNCYLTWTRPVLAYADLTCSRALDLRLATQVTTCIWLPPEGFTSTVSTLHLQLDVARSHEVAEKE